MSESLVPLKFSHHPIGFTEEAETAKLDAICLASEIEAVSDAESQARAVEAQRAIRTIIASVEKARKAEKEPILEAGRKLDKACADFVDGLKTQELRIAQLVGDYQQAELEKVRAAERIASAERERIAREQAEAVAKAEREAAAERERIAREQAEAKASAEAEAAAARAAAANIKNAAARKAAEESARLAQLEAEAKAEANRKLAEEAAAKALESEKRRQAELAAQQGEAVLSVAAPPKAEGQSVREEWEIKRINEFALMKARPDLVRKVEFDLRSIKEELARGLKLPGVEAEKVLKSGVRAAHQPGAINV